MMVLEHYALLITCWKLPQYRIITQSIGLVDEAALSHARFALAGRTTTGIQQVQSGQLTVRWEHTILKRAVR